MIKLHIHAARLAFDARISGSALGQLSFVHPPPTTFPFSPPPTYLYLSELERYDESGRDRSSVRSSRFYGFILSTQLRVLLGPHWTSSHSQVQEAHSTTGNRQSQSYDRHRDEAEGFAVNFVRQRDNDLNIVLIFVSAASCTSPHVLTRVTGWSVLRRDLHLDNLHPPPALGGPERRGRSSPPCPPLQDRQYRFQPRQRS